MTRALNLSLVPHPTTPCPVLDGIEARVTRDGAMLRLDYAMRGRIDAIKVPARDESLRTDNLWQTTCFEAFVQVTAPAYREFNLSPSTRWAAYSFDAFREGMADLAIEAPKITVEVTDGLLRLVADIAIGDDTLPLKLALTTVVETVAGEKSFWSLAHPPGAPEFHSPDCLAATVAPSRPV